MVRHYTFGDIAGIGVAVLLILALLYVIVVLGPTAVERWF